MNILFCYQNGFFPLNGGVQRYCCVLSDYLISHGYNVFFISLFHDQEFRKLAPENYYHLPEKGKLKCKKNKEYYVQLISTLKIDVIINNEATNDRFKFFSDIKNNKVKHVSIFHSNPLFNLKLECKSVEYFFITRFAILNFIKRLKRRVMIVKLVLNTDKLVFLSERYVENIKFSLSISSKKICSISNFIQINSSVQDYEKENSILFVGRLDNVKQVDILITAWQKIIDEFPTWTLNIVGTGPNEITYKNLVKENLINRVNFIGKVDPTGYYRKSKIICLPSKYEGFGLVLVEAMSYGVVPIAFNNWLSLEDIIDDDVSGIIVNDKSAVGLANSLKFLMSNKNILDDMSTKSLEKSKYFDISKVGRDWIKLLNKLKLDD